MAVESPWIYRVMFGQSGPAIHAEDQRPGVDTFQRLVDAVQRCIDEGIFAGDAFQVALQLWSVSHGITSLALTGMIGLDNARDLLRSTREVMQRGLRAGSPSPA
jgi:hypothetical protein